jgi:hypothetical protein
MRIVFTSTFEFFQQVLGRLSAWYVGIVGAARLSTVYRGGRSFTYLLWIIPRILAVTMRFGRLPLCVLPPKALRRRKPLSFCGIVLTGVF